MPKTLPNKIDVEIRRMKIEDLHPAEYNPRSISEKAFAGLSASMDKFGILAHIVWNKRTGNIVGGHQRYRHLVEKGVKETDVLVVDLDENDEVALNITLNNPKIRGDFTPEIMEQLREAQSLEEDFHELALDDLYADLKKRGFEKKEKKIDEEESSSSSLIDDGELPEVGSAVEDDENDGAKAVITCPECGAKWDMETNKIISSGLSEEAKLQKLEENGIV